MVRYYIHMSIQLSHDLCHILLCINLKQLPRDDYDHDCHKLGTGPITLFNSRP
jgi:hypothetical protein